MPIARASLYRAAISGIDSSSARRLPWRNTQNGHRALQDSVTACIIIIGPRHAKRLRRNHSETSANCAMGE